MNWVLLWAILGLMLLLIILESVGVPTTLSLNLKGDIKRETRWLAQYGQLVSALVAMAIVYQMENAANARHWQGAHPPVKAAASILIASFGAAIAGRILKQLLGRVRPNREHA